VVGFVWKLIYAASDGAINVFLRSVGLGFIAVDWLGTISTVMPAMSAAIIWYAVGFHMLIYLAGLYAISPEIYDSADVDGVKPVQKFVFITFPLLAPSLTVNVILSTISVFKWFDLPFVLTGGGPGYMSETIALRIYSYAFERFQIGKALALAVMLGIVAIVTTVFLTKFFKRREELII
jgi:ABC-type sugar transport system permease subunit